jgi:hypothetical protein
MSTSPGEPLVADAVFEGGGVKGTGLVGALSYCEEKGDSGCSMLRLAGRRDGPPSASAGGAQRQQAQPDKWTCEHVRSLVHDDDGGPRPASHG